MKTRAKIREVAVRLGSLTAAEAQQKMCRCPLHADANPSFLINDQRNTYHCFGCGAHGDVFSFVQAIKQCSFYEAVIILAECFGIEVEYCDQTQETKAKRSKMQDLYEAVAKLEKFFVKELNKAYLQTPDDAALQYLVKRFGEPTDAESWCVRWGLGLIRQTDMAHSELAELIPQLETLGLVRVLPNNLVFCIGVGRVAIPIKDVLGRTVGFAARDITNTPNIPKYLNSPASELFKKSQLLFGLSDAARTIGRTQEAVLVEGYTDVMRLHSCGVTNTVARMGTALTPEQIVQLKKAGARHVRIIADQDDAGQLAQQKDSITLLKEGFAVSVVTMDTRSLENNSECHED
ncbi:MAG: CHC2 zinc finger domain-containing protein [Bacteroides sp.]